MLKGDKNITISIGVTFVLFCFFVFGLFKFHVVEYVFQRIVMANNPTVFFPCERFESEDKLNKILDENGDDKVISLRKYLSENDGELYAEAIGNRCPKKYQFVVAFGGDEQKVEIEQILKNQTIDGIPVFLLNR